MSVDETVTQWIESLKDGDQDACEQIWQRYFTELCTLARHKLPVHVRREFDEEDVALSAIDCLYRGIQDGKFPRLNDRNNLWSLLVVITARKVSHRLRDRSAQKRGGAKAQVSAGGPDTRLDIVKNVVGKEPTPQFAAEVAEESERLLCTLDDKTARKIAELKMAGYSNDDIAKHLDCGKRTVERKLNLIRRIWTERDAEQIQAGEPHSAQPSIETD